MNFLEYRNKLHFPSIIGIPDKDLIQVINNIDNLYNEWSKPKKDKETGKIKTYKNGTNKKRTYRESLYILKIIQKRIKDRILSKIELPENVQGGRKKHSNITNAKKHQGKKYILTTDLQDFFPSIKAKKIFETFCELGFNKQFAFYVTRFTTWKGELPQGTPTSTHIANIIFLKTDFKLIEFCKANEITYTRFVDDLTFSSQKDFQNLIKQILEIIKENGLKINWRKTFYKGNQIITGIRVFNHKIDAPKEILEKVKEEAKHPNGVKPYTNYRNNIIKTNCKKICNQKSIIVTK